MIICYEIYNKLRKAEGKSSYEIPNDDNRNQHYRLPNSKRRRRRRNLNAPLLNHRVRKNRIRRQVQSEMFQFRRMFNLPPLLSLLLRLFPRELNLSPRLCHLGPPLFSLFPRVLGLRQRLFNLLPRLGKLHVVSKIALLN